MFRLLVLIILNICITAYAEELKVPVLDLKKFLQNEKEFTDELKRSLHTYGFVLIENHGINNVTIDKTLQEAAKFFSLPKSQKTKYENVITNKGYRSYDRHRADKKSDLQEYWHVGSALYGNIWPEDRIEFKNAFNDLYIEIHEKTLPLLEAISLSMGQDRKFLENFTKEGDSIMRVIHYLPSDTLNTEWKAPHKDPNLLTIIVGASDVGLELQMADGQWLKVPLVPGTIIVSVSNMLESLSNGDLRSAPHRVVMTQLNKSRYSIPFFYHGSGGLSIAPLAESVKNTGGKPLFPDKKIEDSLQNHKWFTKKS